MTVARTFAAALSAILLALVLWIVFAQTVGRAMIFDGDGGEPQRGPVITTG
jgi:hypothetical protein